MHDRSFDVVQKNSYYSADIHYALQMCQWALKPIGIWPLVNNRATRLEQLVSIALLTFCYSVLLFILIPSGRFIFFEGSISTKVGLFGPVGFCLSSTIKYICLILKRTDIERCIEHVERDWRTVQNQTHRSIMLKCSAFSRNLITLCAIFLFSGGISYHTIMQFLSKDKRRNNATIKPLAYPGYDAFFNSQSTPAYEIVFCVHFVTAMIMYTVTTGAYSLLAIFITHISGQIQIQLKRLEGLTNEKPEKDGHRNFLATIVYNHVEILRFSKIVQEALKEICLTEVVECTMIMCMLEYYCIMSWRAGDMVKVMTYLTLLISFTFNIFIFCYIGEVLTEQCSQIGTLSYEIDWYNLPAKKAHDLILLNVISQNPPKLTAEKVIELSLNTFTVVVKTSVVYMNLLRTVTD
nr:odorant receptor 4-like [Osmia lignaria]